MRRSWTSQRGVSAVRAPRERTDHEFISKVVWGTFLRMDGIQRGVVGDSEQSWLVSE